MITFVIFFVGDGPFPGVIDMFGDEGGLTEYRASLLANRGFAALSLPYFDFEDLPRVMKDLNFQYFEEAVRFLQHHPKVSVIRKMHVDQFFWL